MEQYERAEADPPEGQTEQGGEDPSTAAVLSGEADNAKEGVSETHISVLAAASEGQKEGASETQISVPTAASEGAKKQDLEEPSPESDQVAAASGSVNTDDREASENPIETPFEFRSAAPDASPPPTSHRARSRGRKKASPTKFIDLGAAEGTGSEAPVPGASSSSAPVPAAGTHEDVSAIAGGGQGAGPGDDKKQKQACSEPFATVLIAHATPPDSYRRTPSRSRKQYSPKRFAVVAAGASTSVAAPDEGAPTAPARRKKQPRPEHFIPEEAAATARAKAHRSNIVLDRFLSSMARRSSGSDWVTDITAEDADQPKRPRGVETFRVRDASRHAARSCGLRAAISRLGTSCGGASSSSEAAPGDPCGSGRIHAVLVVLGAALALSVVSCVLYYIVGQSSEAAPSGESQDK